MYCLRSQAALMGVESDAVVTVIPAWRARWAMNLRGSRFSSSI